MSVNTVNRVDQVVVKGLCTGCGSCVAACPRNAIEMGETVHGLLVPTIDAAVCNDCGSCSKVCPGDHLEPDLIDHGTDPFIGPVGTCYLVQHRQQELLAAAQSGGAVTGVLLHLLETGYIDRALVTVMPEDGSLRPYSTLTRDPEVIRKSSGSKYCPVSLNTQLSYVRPGERIAVAGLACHVHGIKHLCRHLSTLRRENILLIGLVCDRVLSFGVIDYLICRAGLRKQDVLSIHFRSKLQRGWPGDVRVVARNGTSLFLPARERVACKDFFTPRRCRLCFDKMNILADITCGDPYGISRDVKGRSVMLTRTSAGQGAVQSAIDAGVFASRNISARDFMNGQQIGSKRWDYAVYVRLWNSRGLIAPGVSVSAGMKQINPNPIARHIRERRLFEFPKMMENGSEFRRRLRLTRWNLGTKWLDRLGRFLFDRVAS